MIIYPEKLFRVKFFQIGEQFIIVISSKKHFTFCETQFKHKDTFCRLKLIQVTFVMIILFH